MRFAVCFSMLLCASAFASVVDEVKLALATGDLRLAEALTSRNRTANGTSPELALAASWVARGFLERKDYGSALSKGAETEKLARSLLKGRKLDAEPQLPLALGAAIEVQAQSLAAQGSRDQAVTLLHTQLAQWRGTSIQARIQKNLNLLTLEGHPAPAIETLHALGGTHPVPLAALHGHPVLLFFWAHWCSDCKAEIDVVQKLLAVYGPRGLIVIGPTQHYGYVAGGVDASRAEETRYMESIRAQYFAKIGAMAVPVGEETVRNYGVSTTPTLVLVDKAGIVRMYHPGAMSYDQLEARLHAIL